MLRSIVGTLYIKIRKYKNIVVNDLKKNHHQLAKILTLEDTDGLGIRNNKEGVLYKPSTFKA